MKTQFLTMISACLLANQLMAAPTKNSDISLACELAGYYDPRDINSSEGFGGGTPSQTRYGSQLEIRISGGSSQLKAKVSDPSNQLRFSAEFNNSVSAQATRGGMSIHAQQTLNSIWPSNLNGRQATLNLNISTEGKPIRVGQAYTAYLNVQVGCVNGVSPCYSGGSVFDATPGQYISVATTRTQCTFLK